MEFDKTFFGVSQASCYEYTYSSDGRVAQVIALNHKMLPLWRKTFTSQDDAAYEVFVKTKPSDRSQFGLLTLISTVDFSAKDSNRSGLSDPITTHKTLVEPSRESGQSLATSVRYRWSEKGLKLAAAFVGNGGTPKRNADGVFGYQEEHDSLGRVTSRIFLDQEGQRMRNDAGIAVTNFVYGSSDISISYFDEKLNPIMNGDGLSKLEVTFDDIGRFRVLRWFNTYAKPIALKINDSDGSVVGNGISISGIQGVEVNYNDVGFRNYIKLIFPSEFIEQQFLRPSTFRMNLNSRGQITLLRFFDASDQPAVNDQGSHALQFGYDYRGERVLEKHLGIFGQPILYSERGYSIARATYDNLSRKVSERYFDTADQPITDSDGAHGWDAEFDERGNETARRYVGTDGQATLVNDGYAISRSTYDNLGRQISERYFDITNKPILDKYNKHGWDRNYDDLGNAKTETFVDLFGNPRPGVGCTVHSYTYNEYGWVTSERYFDADGNPTTHDDGSHGWDAKLDAFQNKTLMRYVGVDGSPKLIEDGYATERMKYDEFGRQISTRYFDTSDQPTLDQYGKHGWDRTYDDKANKTVETYLNLAGMPRSGGGCAQHVNTYNRIGLVTSERYFNSDGNPAAHDGGIHGWDAVYNEDREEVSRTYVGIDQKEIEPIGVLVTSIVAGSNAERSGLVNNDVVIEYNGTKVASHSNLMDLIAKTAEDTPWDFIPIIVSRADNPLTLKVAKGKLGAVITTQFGSPSRDSKSIEESKSEPPK
jgi:hypothetical protein